MKVSGACEHGIIAAKVSDANKKSCDNNNHDSDKMQHIEDARLDKTNMSKAKFPNTTRRRVSSVVCRRLSSSGTLLTLTGARTWSEEDG